MPDRVRTLIAGGSRFHREGLALMLERTEHISVVATTGDAAETCAQVVELLPDVVLLDMAMPGGLGAAKRIGATVPSGSARIVALGAPDADEELLACAEAGICGYVPRDSSMAEVLVAVENTARGDAYCSGQMAALLVQRLSVLASGRPVVASAVELTAREREILELRERGLSNKEIAQALYIAVPTVKTHVHNILGKSRAHHRTLENA